jgi:DnaJ family protein C protein 28
MDEWKSIAEQAIQQAMEEGKFDRLPGAGQPLSLDENPYEDPAMWAANHLLRNNGFSPPWVEERRALEKDIQRARLDLLRAWRWVQVVSAETGGVGAGAKAHWLRALSVFGEQVEALNRRIRDCNLKVPAGISHFAYLVVEDEVSAIQGR